MTNIECLLSGGHDATATSATVIINMINVIRVINYGTLILLQDFQAVYFILGEDV